MSTISASEARQTLPAQLDRVESGEEVAITRHGRVVAVLVGPDALASRRASGAWQRADLIGEMLERAREEPVRGAQLGADRVDELIEHIREGRSRP